MDFQQFVYRSRDECSKPTINISSGTSDKTTDTPSIEVIAVDDPQ